MIGTVYQPAAKPGNEGRGLSAGSSQAQGEEPAAGSNQKNNTRGQYQTCITWYIDYIAGKLYPNCHVPVPEDYPVKG